MISNGMLAAGICCQNNVLAELAPAIEIASGQ